MGNLVKRYDAESGVLSDALEALHKVRAMKYRPTRFRSILPVTNGGVPEWAQVLLRDTVESTAEFVPGGQSHTVKPLGSESISQDSFRTLKLISAFQVNNDELQAYEASGVSIEPRRVTAIQTKAEQVLNDIAANGYTVAGGRVKGLFNQDAATSPTDAQVKLAATSMISFADGETAETVADKLTEMAQTFEEDSSELYEAGAIVLPPLEYNHAARVRSTVDNRTALEIFAASHPSVRVVKWNKAAGLGTNSNGRAVVMSNADDVLEMVMLYELRETSRITVHDGIEVGMAMKTAGVIVNEPRGLQYWDIEA